MIEWNHIQDSQPEHGRSIVRVEYDNIYGFGYLCITDYYQYNTTFEEICKYREDNEMSPLNFYWIYEKDFPFPEFPNSVQKENVKEFVPMPCL